jgi:DNA helicase-2/ATP-dependent DNA helicase PcrA
VVEHDGDFLLLACPGSGKTLSAAARVRSLAGRGRRLAVCSYTNVGADRIAAVTTAAGVVLTSEHFTGTLHGLLLRYVLQPFASLVSPHGSLHLSEQPDVTVPFGDKKGIRLQVDQFRFRPNGSLVLKKRPDYLSTVPHADIVEGVGDSVLEAKRRLIRRGLVSFDDALLLALVILRDRPGIADAVARRFDELLLDEAQDTSELQLACLDIIKSTGHLASLVLVGDLEQSIFSFQGASAAGCRALAQRHDLDLIELTQNHRSSQRICDVAVHFCDRDQPDEAVGRDADCQIDPEVILYPPDQPAAAVDTFKQRIDEHGLDPQHAAVLARGNALVDELNGDLSPVSIQVRPERLGRAVAALRSGRLGRRQLQGVERIVSFAAFDEEVLARLGPADRRQLCAASVLFLSELPSLVGDLREWIRAAARALTATTESLISEPKRSGGTVLRSSSEQNGVDVASVFTPPVRHMAAQTVHDIKGEDREAVLVMIDRPRSRRHEAQVAIWETAVRGDRVNDDHAEERRIAFIALTRARRLCVVALPDDDSGRAAAEVFRTRGFA